MVGDGRTLNELAGALIRLRAPEPEDLDVFREFDLDSEGSRRWGATHLPVSRDAQRRWYEEDCSRGRTTTGHGWPSRPMPENSSGALPSVWTTGGTACFPTPSARNPARGKGYGTEAIVLLLRFYFAELGCQKCDTVIYAFNEGSMRFHERLGFVVEVRRRRGVCTQGQHHDAVKIGMTREEFDARHGLIPPAAPTPTVSV